MIFIIIDCKKFVTKNELQNLSQEDRYFKHRIPLENIDRSKLLKGRNYKDKDLAHSIMRKYFYSTTGEKNIGI